MGLAREKNFSGVQMQVKPGLTGFTSRPEKSHRNRRAVSAASSQEPLGELVPELGQETQYLSWNSGSAAPLPAASWA